MNLDISLGDLVSFNESGFIYSGRAISRQKNNYLLLVDSDSFLGTDPKTDNFARQFLKLTSNKKIHWISEKQVTSISKGTLEDQLEILEQTRLNVEPDLQAKLEQGIITALSEDNPEVLRKVLLDFFRGVQLPIELEKNIDAISKQDLSLILSELKKLDQDLKNLELKENQQKNLTLTSNEFNLEEQTDKSILPSKEKPIMSKPALTEMIKADGVDAGYRIASKQSTKAVKAAVTNVMRNKGSKKAHVNAMADFMDSELGEAFISTGLGYALHFMPGVSLDPRVQRLAKEFRVEGMSSAGNLVMDAATQFLLPAIQETLKTIPEEDKVRVVEEVEDEETELEEVPAAKSKARA